MGPSNEDDRGKGAADPQWMPAIMGWASIDRVRERARELYSLFKEEDEENSTHK